MKIRVIIITLFAFFFLSTGYGQDSDFGVWYGLNAEYSVSKKVEVDVSAMIRTFNNASEIEQSYLEGGIGYKLNKYFSVAGSYRASNKLENNSEYHFRHKLFADAKTTVPIGNFSASLRLRFQVQKKTFIENVKDKIPDYHSRLKLKLIYKSPGFPLNPYISVESFSQLFKNADRIFDKNRFASGIEYKISKKHSIEAEYIFERDFEPHISDMSIASLSYNFKF